jgi:hypothetical protein
MRLILPKVCEAERSKCCRWSRYIYQQLVHPVITACREGNYVPVDTVRTNVHIVAVDALGVLVFVSFLYAKSIRL